MDWGLVGNEWAVKVLTHHIAEDHVRHAYLITGPDGIGKHSLTLGFAKSLLCTAPPKTGQSCGSCRTCMRIEESTHPDVHLATPEPDKAGLVVDDIRNLQRSISLTPVESSRRLAILPDFDRATEQAANALLKTLEEPPGEVILLLTGRDSESLLPTIVSRCEVIRLRPVPTSVLEEALQKEGYSIAEAAMLAGVAAGLPGRARSLGEDEDALINRGEQIGDLITLLSMVKSDRLIYVEPLVRSGSLPEKRDRTTSLIETWLRFWRDVLLISAGVETTPGNPDRIEDVRQIAENVTIGQATTVLRSMYMTLTSIQQNANVRLALENLVLSLPNI